MYKADFNSDNHDESWIQWDEDMLSMIDALIESETRLFAGANYVVFKYGKVILKSNNCVELFVNDIFKWYAFITDEQYKLLRNKLGLKPIKSYGIIKPKEVN